MTKKMYTLTVPTKKGGEIVFHVNVDPCHVPYWREQGIEIFELVNVIPTWVLDYGIPIRLWCFFQDLLNFKNPFSGK